MFRFDNPNILSFIIIKFVKHFRNILTVRLLHALVFLKRDCILLAFLDSLVYAHPFDVGIVVLAFHHELAQSFRHHKGIGIATIETPIFSTLKACNKQQKLYDFQRLVVRIDVACKVVDLLLAKLVIRNAKEYEHSL